MTPDAPPAPGVAAPPGGERAGTRTYDVFISHSAKDKSIADAMCTAMEFRGIRCWIAPRDIRFGTEWSAAIVEALADVRVMVLIFSADANESPQVRREVQCAFERGVTVIPFRVQDVRPEKGLEYYINSVHWLDAMNPPLEDHLARLTVSVQNILGAAAPETKAGSTPKPVAPKPQPRGSLPREIWSFLRTKFLDDPKKRAGIITTIGLFIGFWAATRGLDALTQGLAWIDEKWEGAIATLAVGAGMATFSLVLALKHRNKDGPDVPSSGRSQLFQNLGALLACIAAVACLGGYLWTYHRCIVTLDDHARRVLQVNAAPDDATAAALRSQPLPNSVPLRLCLPLFLPEEIQSYNDGIIRQKGLPPTGERVRAGISTIISADPQWLFDKLEHDYPQEVARTKLMLLSIYLLIFIFVGLAGGLSYEPIESTVALLTSGSKRA